MLSATITPELGAEGDAPGSGENERNPSEMNPGAPAVETSPWIELAFELDRKRVSLDDVRTLTEGQVLFLSTAPDFPVTLSVQGRTVALARPILADGRPAVQIEKLFGC